MNIFVVLQVAYLLTFIIVLSAGVISKGCVLFMTSQIKPGRTHSYCSRRNSLTNQSIVDYL